MVSINLSHLYASFTTRNSLYMANAYLSRRFGVHKLEINSRLKPTFKWAWRPLLVRELNLESQINLTRAGLMSTKATRMAGIWNSIGPNIFSWIRDYSMYRLYIRIELTLHSAP